MSAEDKAKNAGQKATGKVRAGLGKATSKTHSKVPAPHQGCITNANRIRGPGPIHMPIGAGCPGLSELTGHQVIPPDDAARGTRTL